MSDRGFAFAAAVRVIAGVHDDASDGGTDTEISRLAGLAESDDFVFEVAYLTDCCFAGQENVSHFA